MNIKYVIATAACAVLFAGAAVAAEPNEPEAVVGFGSGTGMGVGAAAGSASSVADGFSAQMRASGAGSQSFGGGFDQQQTMGAGPLASDPSTASGSGPTLTNPY